MQMIRRWIQYAIVLLALSEMQAKEPCPHCVKAPADSKELEGMKISLISENLTIQAGKPFRVAFKIEHKEGFHTYWKNPGIVGIPTKMNWDLPEGFTAGEVQWPYPELSKMAAYPCFGYERDVLLMMEVTPPTELNGDSVNLKGSGQWMCCSSACYPGYEDFSLTLKVGEEKRCPLNAPLFEKAVSELPAKTEKLSAEMLNQADDQKIQLLIKSSDPELQVIRVYNEDGQTTPDISHGIKEISTEEFLFIAERSKYGPKSVEAFPFVVETNQGFYTLTSEYPE